jgi:hypothetical protein
MVNRPAELSQSMPNHPSHRAAPLMAMSVLRTAGQTFVVISRNGGQTWPLPLDRCRGPAASIGDAARHSHRHRRSVQDNSADLPRQHRTAVCTTTASPRLGRGKRIQQRAVSAVTVQLIERRNTVSLGSTALTAYFTPSAGLPSSPIPADFDSPQEPSLNSELSRGRISCCGVMTRACQFGWCRRTSCGGAKPRTPPSAEQPSTYASATLGWRSRQWLRTKMTDYRE